MENEDKTTVARAPRPTRRSLSRSVYDAVYALSGEGTIAQIIELLPTTDDADRWNNFSPKRVFEILYQSSDQGYLVRNPVSERWQIAPLSYYRERQLARNSGFLERGGRAYGEGRGAKPAKPSRSPVPKAPAVAVAPDTQTYTIRKSFVRKALIAAAAFSIGLALGSIGALI